MADMEPEAGYRDSWTKAKARAHSLLQEAVTATDSSFTATVALARTAHEKTADATRDGVAGAQRLRQQLAVSSSELFAGVGPRGVGAPFTLSFVEGAIGLTFTTEHDAPGYPKCVEGVATGGQAAAHRALRAGTVLVAVDGNAVDMMKFSSVIRSVQPQTCLLAR